MKDFGVGKSKEKDNKNNKLNLETSSFISLLSFSLLILFLLLSSVFFAVEICPVEKMPTIISISHSRHPANPVIGKTTNEIEITVSLNWIDEETGESGPLPKRNITLVISVFDLYVVGTQTGTGFNFVTKPINETDESEAIFPAELNDNGIVKLTIPMDDIFPERPDPRKVSYSITATYTPEQQTPKDKTYMGSTETEQYVPAAVPAISIATCFPLLAVLGLLMAAMYATGRNPFAYLDFSRVAFRVPMIKRRAVKGITVGAPVPVSKALARGIEKGREALKKIKLVGKVGKLTEAAGLAGREALYKYTGARWVVGKLAPPAKKMVKAVKELKKEMVELPVGVAGREIRVRGKVLTVGKVLGATGEALKGGLVDRAVAWAAKKVAPGFVKKAKRFRVTPAALPAGYVRIGGGARLWSISSQTQVTTGAKIEARDRTVEQIEDLHLPTWAKEKIYKAEAKKARKEAEKARKLAEQTGRPEDRRKADNMKVIADALDILANGNGRRAKYEGLAKKERKFKNKISLLKNVITPFIETGEITDGMRAAAKEAGIEEKLTKTIIEGEALNLGIGRTRIGVSGEVLPGAILPKDTKRVNTTIAWINSKIDKLAKKMDPLKLEMAGEEAVKKYGKEEAMGRALAIEDRRMIRAVDEITAITIGDTIKDRQNMEKELITTKAIENKLRTISKEGRIELEEKLKANQKEYRRKLAESLKEARAGRVGGVEFKDEVKLRKAFNKHVESLQKEFIKPLTDLTGHENVYIAQSISGLGEKYVSVDSILFSIDNRRREIIGSDMMEGRLSADIKDGKWVLPRNTRKPIQIILSTDPSTEGGVDRFNEQLKAATLKRPYIVSGTAHVVKEGIDDVLRAIRTDKPDYYTNPTDADINNTLNFGGIDIKARELADYTKIVDQQKRDSKIGVNGDLAEARKDEAMAHTNWGFVGSNNSYRDPSKLSKDYKRGKRDNEDTGGCAEAVRTQRKGETKEEFEARLKKLGVEYTDVYKDKNGNWATSTRFINQLARDQRPLRRKEASYENDVRFDESKDGKTIFMADQGIKVIKVKDKKGVYRLNTELMSESEIREANADAPESVTDLATEVAIGAIGERADKTIKRARELKKAEKPPAKPPAPPSLKLTEEQVLGTIEKPIPFEEFLKRQREEGAKKGGA